MFFVDLLVALAVGLLLTVIFGALFRNQGPWGIWWVFLILIFLVAWAGGVWVRPFGPVWFDVAWLPFLFVGLFFALLLAAIPPLPRRTYGETVVEAQAEDAVIAAFSVFFWVLLIGLLVAIVLAYV